MTAPNGLAWQTSSYCNNGSCVRVAIEPDQVLVSDSKDPDGPVLSFTPGEWRAFVGGVKDGDFDGVGLLAEIGHDRRLLIEAAGLIASSRRVSTASFQRKVRVGFVKAARLLDLLEQCGVVGPYRGSQGHEVLVTPEGLPAHLGKLGITAPAPASPVSGVPAGTPESTETLA